MRKTALVKITEGDPQTNRDFGKIFVIKEMAAVVAERWATRALLALARSGVQLPENAASAGWAVIAVMGFQALSHANFDDIQPLLDEMWQCVMIQPDHRHPDLIRHLMWSGADGEGADIEEIATMLKLRTEVFNLHAGFSLPGVGSTSSTSSTTSTSAGSSNTRTSTPLAVAQSRRQSPPGKRR